MPRAAAAAAGTTDEAISAKKQRRRPGKVPLPLGLTGLDACARKSGVVEVWRPRFTYTSSDEEDSSSSAGSATSPTWMASSVLDDNSLFLGSAADALNDAALASNGVTHVVNCTKDIMASSTLAASTLRIPINDACDEPLAEYIPEVCAFIHAARKGGGTVLVHCRGGVSRSAAFCVAYLMMLQRCSPDAALEVLVARRPSASPNIGFLLSLEALFAEIHRPQQPQQPQQTADDAESDRGMSCDRRIVYSGLVRCYAGTVPFAATIAADSHNSPILARGAADGLADPCPLGGAFSVFLQAPAPIVIPV